jgi:two-component system, sensor histidine kinase and response regulator
MTDQATHHLIEDTLLVVDDSPTRVTALKHLLVKAGYVVDTVTDGVQALAYVDATPPDLILLDIEMPEMNGYDVCIHLKSDDQTSGIPIIFISVHDDIKDIVHGFKVGGVDYIPTPFRPEEVLARVNSHLTLAKQRRELKALRERETQQFESINEVKNSFIHTATHDLKNPLFVISGYVGLLEMEPQAMNNPAIRLAVEGIQDGVDKMTSLITDILDLVQVEAGIGISMRPVLVGDFLRNSVKGFDILAEQRNVKFTLLPPADEEAMILVDDSQFYRVMDNLISNAIKYTPSGGWIKVKSHVMPDEVIIEVMDTGVGIPADALPLLFDKFYRVDRQDHQKIDGTGLGLAIAKAVVEQHTGTIRVTSKPGKGSAFVISLPRYFASDDGA